LFSCEGKHLGQDPGSGKKDERNHRIKPRGMTCGEERPADGYDGRRYELAEDVSDHRQHSFLPRDEWRAARATLLRTRAPCPMRSNGSVYLRISAEHN